MLGKSSPERESFWRELLDRQAASGTSIRAFCLSAGFSQPPFYAWRKRLRDQGASGARPVAKPRRRVKVADDDRAFIPLMLGHSSSALEVIHPCGYRVRILDAVNADALRKVFEVLDQRGAP